MTDDNPPETSVIFLLGAGASVDAGIPDTFKFVSDFEGHVKQNHPEFLELHSTILKVREEFNERIFGKERRRVDIEQYLETLRRLIDRETDPLLDFYEGKKFSIANSQDNFVELKKLLENYIRERVIVDDQSKLEYLRELLNFDMPLEIFSTNYDTCIEQLSHIHYKRYTDGFDIYWNAENFSRNFDVKHYKMHGSVIWYQSLKTKECVKIPAHAFLKGKQIELKLIYGEDVSPLVIYPAQKAEYIEPLTDLQLMFKRKLFSKTTKFLVVVGYSFRDDYIVHMLWDAARVNENLHIILISPNANQIFENKLKYINKETNDLSRIYDRVICLPYPFFTVISQLRNHYLENLTQFLNNLASSLDTERVGHGQPDWKHLLKLCIDAGFLAKAEYVLKKTNENWQDLRFDTHNELLLYGFRALLHSVICGDGHEEIWLKRVNDTLRLFSTENFYIDNRGHELAFFGFRQNGNGITVENFLKDWLTPLILEKKKKIELLSPKFKSSLDRINTSLDKLEEFCKYLDNLSKGVRWYNYKESKDDSPEVKSFITQLQNAKTRGSYEASEADSIILGVEKGRLKSFLGAESFEFRLQ